MQPSIHPSYTPKSNKITYNTMINLYNAMINAETLGDKNVSYDAVKGDFSVAFSKLLSGRAEKNIGC